MPRADNVAPAQPAETSAARAARELQNARELQQTRSRLGEVWNSFLRFIAQKQQIKTRELQAELEEDYRIWAAFFELLKGEFKELWDMLAVIEHDVPGWFRSAPNSAKHEFLGISREGYNFAACIEQNSKPNAPFPSKWMMISVAHAAGRPCGIGDERMLGRKEPIDDNLSGLQSCTKDIRLQLEAAAELKKRTLEYPLVFEIYSQQLGQRYVKVPVGVLQKHSLVEIGQNLFAALNKDILTDLRPLIGSEEKLQLEWRKGNS